MLHFSDVDVLTVVIIIIVISVLSTTEKKPKTF